MHVSSLVCSSVAAIQQRDCLRAKQKKNRVGTSVDINHHTCVSTQRVRMRLSGTHDPWPATAIRTRHFSSSLTATRQPGGRSYEQGSKSECAWNGIGTRDRHASRLELLLLTSMQGFDCDARRDHLMQPCRASLLVMRRHIS